MTLKKRLNKLVKEISKIEGGKVELDAPQIREVLRCLAIIQSKSWAMHPAALEYNPISFIASYTLLPSVERAAKKLAKARAK